ncbi:hypothetical protein [Marinospirillum insulare]|uniref:Uncharacterized protein n=1 Tax=Marinospirillum insulare TaxID=217169 RepID=A0ABQ6A046_9GAMM|nr:hypothetical protein [Marinospirillum insulare]GLR63500.1 hypothetical protein GCM10007878_09350 [Marinospirillum insulare]
MQQLSTQKRYATLEAMGTRLWVPRFQLPGAATSQACDWPAPVKKSSARERLLEQQAATLAQETAASAQPKSQPLGPQLDQPAAEPNLAAQPLAQTSQQPLQPAAAPLQVVEPLYADVWLLANGWQLVMENLTGQPGLQEVDIKLLHNLLVALYPGGLGIIGQQFFSWPLPGIPIEAGNEGELNMSLLAFLTGARFQGVQLAGCLVFGERLQSLMSKAASSLRVFPAPSLRELQQSSTAKQAFWQQAGSSGLRASFASSPVIL